MPPGNTVVFTDTPKGFLFETGAASHRGMVRKENEDNYVVRPESGVWAVADGIGGEQGGKVASGVVTETLASIGRAASATDLLARFEERIVRANDQLRDIARARGYRAMGATVAALIVHGEFFASVWSGDSRVYRVRAGEIEQLSRDHTEVQELVDKGVLTKDEAATWPRRNVITRAVGVSGDPELEIEHGQLQAGDIFVICSDGLTGHVGDDEIAKVARSREPQTAADALVELTLDRGARDNVTVVILRVSAGQTTISADAVNERRASP